MRAYFSKNKKFDYALAAALTRTTELALTKVKAVMYRALEYAATDVAPVLRYLCL
jgi:hypothetical protein